MKKSLLLGGVFATLAALLLAPAAQAGLDDDTVAARVFNDGSTNANKISYWNKGLGTPTIAGVDLTNSNNWIQDTISNNVKPTNTNSYSGYQYPKLQSNQAWGMPYYTAKGAPNSNSASVTVTKADVYGNTASTCVENASTICSLTMRMPNAADTSTGSDSIVVVNDTVNNITVGLWQTWKTGGNWYAVGIDRYSTDTTSLADAGSGLSRRWSYTDASSPGNTAWPSSYGLGFNNTTIDPLNRGHRGLPGYIRGIRLREVEKVGDACAKTNPTNAEIETCGDNTLGHRLEMFWFQTEPNVPAAYTGGTVQDKSAFFPMTGGEGSITPNPDGTPNTRCLTPTGVARTGCVPEGAVIRIRPALDLGTITGLNKYEFVIAKTLQKYGAVIGDNSGSGNILKLQSNVATDTNGVSKWSWPTSSGGLGIDETSLSKFTFGQTIGGVTDTQQWSFVPGGFDPRCPCTRPVLP